VVRRRPGLGTLEADQEALGGVADLAVGDAQLVEVRAAVRLGPMAGRDHELARTARPKLVLGHQPEVLAVHEDLVLRDSHGQELGDVLDRQ
jgi:hypothetical protein